MIVEALCFADTWDSESAVMYFRGRTYQIERDSKLAQVHVAAGNGKTRPAFEFDRNRGPDDKPHDYSCKKPGCESLKPFKTLAELGTHTKTAHKEVRVESEDEPVDYSDRTCTICQPNHICKSAYGLRLHNEKAHPVDAERAPAMQAVKVLEEMAAHSG